MRRFTPDIYNNEHNNFVKMRDTMVKASKDPMGGNSPDLPRYDALLADRSKPAPFIVSSRVN